MLQILHNPRCSKSRETLQIIQDSDTQVEIIEYLKDVPSRAALEEVVQKLDIKPIDLIRKGEDIYKEQFKGKTLSDSEWIEAMVANPKLIERPIVIKGDKAVIGRPPETVKSLL
ncbi:arsenate reductase (glutaredoxin) [Roseivirga sp. E12]|uniref:arsenate reductase (glutaredoxin) n=1 Tax=Roseivirga sp. E12 TaxID=2819237 RepID=UPI001ABCB577|nr:arsenate reductase (glutaredoxin) [Roseivirga sp. E12]MBO3698212.1 arsenate reductase (glutaredoxin) [Roseivirga sp. E12]